MNAFRPNAGIVLGDNIDRWGEAAPVAFPAADLGKHTIVTGTTGSGKSTLLRNVALQFFKEGGTVIVLDPHDDLILEATDGLLPILARDPDRRSQTNTLLLDFAEAWPPQLNLLTSGPVRERAVQVERAMRCIEAAEEANWSGAVRMRELLEHALHIILHHCGEYASLFHVEAFLSEPVLRKSLLAELEGEQAIWESLRFWERTHQLIAEDPRQTDGEMMQYPLRRIGRFLTKPLLRRTLALPALHPEQALDLEALMNGDEPSMLLVPLSAARLGEDTKRILGTLLLQQISDIFKARAALPREARKPVLVLIDEFAELAASDQIGTLVKNLLAQDRKFGAAVLLATQSLAQLPHEVRQEVRNNANNKIVLRAANRADAEAAIADIGSDLLRPLDALDLAQFYGYARVLFEGEPQPPFSFRSLRPWHPSRRIPRTPPLAPRPWPDTPASAHLDRLCDQAPRSPLAEKSAAADGLFADLLGTSEADFSALVSAQREVSAVFTLHLLWDRETEPDPTERLRLLSRSRCGLPWWFYEAEYRRLRLQTVKELAGLKEAQKQALEAVAAEMGRKTAPGSQPDGKVLTDPGAGTNEAGEQPQDTNQAGEGDTSAAAAPASPRATGKIQGAGPDVDLRAAIQQTLAGMLPKNTMKLTPRSGTPDQTTD